MIFGEPSRISMLMDMLGQEKDRSEQLEVALAKTTQENRCLKKACENLRDQRDKLTTLLEKRNRWS